MSAPLELSTAISRYGHTAPVLDGEVRPDGVVIKDAKPAPIIGAYRRMVRELAYDVAELAPTTYLIAKEAGIPFTAIPVFLMRRFHHSGIAVLGNAGIDGPKDLEGRAMGVRAYSVTSGVWSRGILADDYGVDLGAIEWVVDDEDHVTSYVPPTNVRAVAPGESLVELLRDRRIQAAFTGIAGIGRSGPPQGEWEGKASEAPEYRELFPDAKELETRWYQREGVLPLHSVVVIRDELVAEHPWLPAALYETFEKAKAPYLATLDGSGSPDTDTAEHLKNRSIVDGDPLPYGLGANRAAIETLIRYARTQHLIDGTPAPESLFHSV
ncbi:ABC transporter substrate-binding protein [Amycolatopsis acidicola]|uniref:ABC transporter substrate-binding protein n=1 Tax=Amycolatopsis acidicola TaxID=2596893 RepID=A0A5N0V0Q9_9PSEU|nr:ABC transporter substrate-binding protein [Amycolatopsis acidicola]KAA9160057.1 ABC transporter substrate-binding protein [Amycolatopsis acidicola]